MIKTNFFTKEQIDEIDSKLYHKGSIIRDPAHKCEITKLWEALHNVLIANGAVYIGEDGYWYVDGERTEVKAQGEQGIPGEDGKDGITPTLRVSNDGMSLEISNDGGQTWSPFVKDFNKLRVIGYLDSTDKLPKNAKVGDIYGVWNKNVDNSVTGTKGAYELYINTILDWLLDYEITKAYSYDTELPSSATDGTVVLVPVSDLTLDKEKVDGYKVYKYSIANNGWVMVLNTAEIYAGKDDIINYGDNVYALVQGDEPNTYQLYKRQVGWVYFGTNASITYKLVQNVSEGAEDNVLSGKAVKDAIEGLESSTGSLEKEFHEFKEEVKETYGEYDESPEFVRVYLDNEGHILWGIHQDGNIYFGAGVPQQVKDYINRKVAEINSQIDDILGIDNITEKIDSLKEVIDFLETYKNSDSLQKLLAEQDARINALSGRLNDASSQFGEALQELDDKKVDKEEGKSLIDAEYAEGVSYIENPEFVKVELDADGRIVSAVREDGSVYVAAGLDIAGQEVSSVIESPEFIRVWLDGAGHILLGIRNDGDIVFGIGVPSAIKAYIDKKLKEAEGTALDTDVIKSLLEEVLVDYVKQESLDEQLEKKIDGEYVENPEFVQVTTDDEGKVLEGIRNNGEKVLPGGADINGKVKHDGIITEVVDNPEFLEAKVDAEGKLIEGINANGEKVFGVIPPQIRQYVDENAVSGTGIQDIEYDEETGDIYATYDDDIGVTDIYMDEVTGDIFVEIEE